MPVMPIARDGVNKSLGVRGDRLKPLVGAGGRSQKNRRKPHPRQLGQILARLFHNHVGHQHAVGAGRRCIVGKPAQAVAQNRIEITEDHQAGCRPRRANLAGQLQHVLQPRAARHSPFPGTLDHRPIGQRIAEGHPQFDHVRARIDGRKRNGARGIEAGSPAVR